MHRADDGETFVVKDQDGFAANVIPNYFEHSNFSSFARQLNFYGFKKMHPIQMKMDDSYGSGSGRERQSKPKQVRFHHPNFKQGRKDLLSNIFRSTRKKNTVGRPGSGGGTDKNSGDKNNNNCNKNELQVLKSKFSCLETKVERMEESIAIIKQQVREMAELQRRVACSSGGVYSYHHRYGYGGQNMNMNMNMNMPPTAQSMPNHSTTWLEPHHGLASFSDETLASEPLPYKTHHHHHQIGQTNVPMEITPTTPSWPPESSSLVSASPASASASASASAAPPTLKPSPHVKEMDPSLLPPPPPPAIASASASAACFLRGFSNEFPESESHIFPDWANND